MDSDAFERFFDRFQEGEVSLKSVYCLAGAWMLEFAYLFVLAILNGGSGKLETHEVFGPVFEWIFALCLLASLLFAAVTDVIHAQITNLRTFVIVSVLCRVFMSFMINIGLLALFGAIFVGVVLIFADAHFGGGVLAFLLALLDALGFLMPIIVILYLIGALLFGGLML